MSKHGKSKSISTVSVSENLRMADLARLAGVSKSTVSRALADSPVVNARTKERIRKLARQHNYRLNTAARNFRLKETLTIGVIIPEAYQHDWRISDPFFLELLGGIADAVEEKGHRLLLAKMNAQSGDWIEQFVKTRTTDGLILIGQGSQHDSIEAIATYYRPIVVWGAQVNDEQHYITVGSDNKLGGYLATAHLIEQGRKRVAFIGNSAPPEAKLRFKGYLQALEEHGISFDPSLLQETAEKRNTGYASVMKLLGENIEFDGIFATSDMYAIGAMKALREAGITVPQDVGVVGYDDIDIAAYYHPSLTSIHQDRHDGGSQLIECLLNRIEGKPVEPIVLDTRLIIRESSIAPPEL